MKPKLAKEGAGRQNILESENYELVFLLFVVHLLYRLFKYITSIHFRIIWEPAQFSVRNAALYDKSSFLWWSH